MLTFYFCCFEQVIPFSFQVYQLTIYNHNKTFVLSNFELLSPLVLCSNPSDGLGLTSRKNSGECGQSWRILFGAPFKVKSVINLVMWINNIVVACLSLLNNNTIVDGRVGALIAVKISFWTDWRQNWRYFFSNLDLHEKDDEVILMGESFIMGSTQNIWI